MWAEAVIQVVNDNEGFVDPGGITQNVNFQLANEIDSEYIYFQLCE